MAFTSRTTGNPKCVLHSFNTTLPAVHQVNADMGVTEREVQLVYLPVCLNWGYLCLLQAVVSGSRAVLLERFSAKEALELIQRERLTYIATAPASIVAMLNEPGLSNYDVSSLRVVITGGASAAIETIRDYQARMPGHLIELYGMLETGFHTYTRFSDDPAKVRAVQIETDPARLGGSGDTEVILLGDAAETLGALLPLLQRKADRGFLTQAQAGMAAWRRRLDELEDQTRDPIQPQYLMRVVDRCAARDAILASDSGTVATWSARHFDVRGDRHYLLSANLATIAAGVPYAIAAQWAHPGRACIAVTGSDGFAKVMGELLTAIQYKLPVKVVVSNVSSLGRRLRTGENGTSGGPADFASWASANGALGLRVEHAADVEPAVRRAFSFPGPALVVVGRREIAVCGLFVEEQ